MRTILQSSFLVVTVVGVFVVAGNAERWCPFGGVEAMYTYLTEGNLTCSLAVSNFYVLGAVLVVTLLIRRAFCGYVCPIGTLSDWIHRLSARKGKPPISVPRRADAVLSLLKYAVWAVVLAFTYTSSELVFRGFDPCYALISRHGEDITFWAYVVLGGLALGSVVIAMPFCRWLCPFAAVLNPLARFGLTRVKRYGDDCAGCGKCARVCPMAIPVDEVDEVTHARCISCLKCLQVCPKDEAAALSWGPPSRSRTRWPNSVVASVILVAVSAAVAAAFLAPLPSFVAVRGAEVASTSTFDLRVADLTCRGRANLLMYFLERDDDLALPDYVKLLAWPGPGWAGAQITVGSTVTQFSEVARAVTEPYYDATGGAWLFSPFEVEGFDPLADTD